MTQTNVYATSFLITWLLPGRLAVQAVRYHVPQILLDGLVAVRAVLLRLERLLVLNHLLDVLPTRLHAAGDLRKQVASRHLFCRHRSRAFHFLAHVHAVTVGVGGCRHAVRAKQHLRAAVLTVLTGFC